MQFLEFQLDDLDDYKDMITCLDINKKDCKSQKHCSFMRKNTCALILPEKNLYNNNINRDIYFMKLADEIVRYSKIRKYLFTPREFLSFERVNYKINDNEIILLEEILFDSYLDNIKLRENDTFIDSTNIYDIVNPNDKINYSNTIPENMLRQKRGKETNEEKITEGKETNEEKQETGLMVDCTAKNDYVKKNLTALSNNGTIFQVNPYKSDGICGFQMTQFIINDYLGNNISIDKIKEKLGNVYSNLKMPDNGLIINKYNVSEWSVFSYVNWVNNNRNVSDQVISRQPSDKNKEIVKEIKKETYALTEIDLFLLFTAYNIPTIIKMKQGQSTLLNSSVTTFNTSNDEDDRLYIIISKKKKLGKIPNRLFGLLKINNVYKIPKQIVNKELLLDFKGKKPINDVNKFIEESLIFQKEKTEKKRKQDKEAQSKRREKKVGKQKIKKIGKKKLPSK